MQLKERITPADAGKTGLLAFPPCADRDHPRGCGENSRRKVERMIVDGSPPRMRGKPDRVLAKSEQIRITPAGAGKTVKSSVTTPPGADHPRVCGENIVMRRQ